MNIFHDLFFSPEEKSVGFPPLLSLSATDWSLGTLHLTFLLCMNTIVSSNLRKQDGESFRASAADIWMGANIDRDNRFF